MKRLLTLYVARHGETEWNAEKRMQGRLDSKLTEKGKRDAMLLGERLKGTRFEQIISSPSGRALETAELVRGGKSIPVTTDERLLEIHLGAWQGKTDAEIKGLYPAQFHSYWNLPELYENQGGESFHEVKQRVSEFIGDLEKRVPSGNVLVITHGVVIKALYLICRNASINEIWNPPFIHGTSLTVVSVAEGRRELLLEGCVEHCRHP
nr:histidine phosphatase family protein [Mesobacillus foraminis]